MESVINSSDEVDGRRIRTLHEHADDLLKGSTSVDDEPCEHSMKDRGDHANCFEMSDIFTKERQMKEELVDLVYKLSEFVETLPEEFEAILSTLYGDTEDVIAELIDKKDKDKIGLLRNYTIVVAGEINSQMNIFLNILVGSDIIPSSIVLAPSIVCVHAIPKGTEQYFEIQMANGSIEKYTVPSSTNQALTTLEELLQKLLKDKECERLDVYGHLPNFGSKAGVTIVIHPSEDSEKLFSLVTDASMLIYVFNGASPDEEHRDKLKLLCKHLQEDENKRNLNSFDPHCMMFVFSNWDAVEQDELSHKSAWQTVVTNIQKYFPGISEDGHIFKLRSTMMQLSQRPSAGKPDDLETLGNALRAMIVASQLETIQRHYSCLDSFLQHVRKHATVRIRFALNDKITRDVLLEEFEKCTKLRIESRLMQIDLKHRARSRCTQMVVLLETHLKKSSIQNHIKSKFYSKNDMTLPKNNIDAIRSSVKKYIQTLILEEIEAWEQTSNHYQRTVHMIEEMFEEKCQMLREAYLEVAHSNELTDEPTLEISLGSEESDEDEPDNLTTGQKAFLAVTAPLWIPLGVVASMVVIPVIFGIDANDDRKLKQFQKDSSPFLDKWLKEALKDFLKRKSIDKCVLENYLSLLERKIEAMCAHMLPVSMKLDILQRVTILNDDRASIEIVEELSPIKTSVQEKIILLRLYHSKFLAQDTVNVADIKEMSTLCHGHCSELYSAQYCGKDVTLKFIKATCNELYAHFEHLETLRRLHHENIVGYLGVSCTDILPGSVGGQEPEQISSFRLMFMFEKCETNLEEYLLNCPKLLCGNLAQPSRKEALQFYSQTAQAICTALLYLHGKGYTHGKISMANTLLQNGTVKIIGPSVASHAKRIDFSRLTPPEVMSSNTVGKEADIFNLGSLLWELWYGRRPARKFLSTLSRPSCTAKHAMPEGLARVVEKCWESNPEDRPTASKVLEEMFALV